MSRKTKDNDVSELTQLSSERIQELDRACCETENQTPYRRFWGF